MKGTQGFDAAVLTYRLCFCWHILLLLRLTCLFLWHTQQANEPKRAVQLRGIIERLGPAYVKVAQALSTRVDLLSPQYFTQIQLLQDRVPPFPCEQAKEVSRGWVGCLVGAHKVAAV